MYRVQTVTGNNYKTTDTDTENLDQQTEKLPFKDRETCSYRESQQTEKSNTCREIMVTEKKKKDLQVTSTCTDHPHCEMNCQTKVDIDVVKTCAKTQ